MIDTAATQTACRMPKERTVSTRSNRCAVTRVWYLGLVITLWGTMGAHTGLAQQSSPNQSADVRSLLPVGLDDGADTSSQSGQSPFPDALDVDQMLSPSGLTATLKILLLLTVLSLAPSILIMTTCFIRFVIVLGLLRQALGTQQLPPNQVILSLCLFLTFAIMAPVWTEAYEQGIRPYTDPVAGQASPSFPVTFDETVRPLRRFMFGQIESTDNFDGVWLLLRFQKPNLEVDEAITFDQVPLSVLLPAYMLSELKTAFVIGFQLYLPFVVIDMVISSILVSMGMMMLPPVMISLPFKLLLFVLIDGWYLTVGMLLESVRATVG